MGVWCCLFFFFAQYCFALFCSLVCTIVRFVCICVAHAYVMASVFRPFHSIPFFVLFFPVFFGFNQWCVCTSGACDRFGRDSFSLADLSYWLDFLTCIFGINSFFFLVRWKKNRSFVSAAVELVQLVWFRKWTFFDHAELGTTYIFLMTAKNCCKPIGSLYHFSVQ